ncbi:MAG TPA: hypothetical protein PK570_07500 [Thermoanaerobaculia bacterium]|nr:hypothetical protein [Thermoanaerobaculia bacterium]
MRSLLRPAAAGLSLSVWMALRRLGVTGRGAVHLLLAAGLLLFPWRELGAPPAGGGPEPD